MSKFWITGIYGGSDGRDAVGAIAANLKRELHKLNDKTYSNALGDFGFRLVVGGDISNTGEANGFANVRMFKGKDRVTFDLTMNQDVWSCGPTKIKEFLRVNVLSGFESIVKRAAAKKVPLAGAELLADIGRALDKM